MAGKITSTREARAVLRQLTDDEKRRAADIAETRDGNVAVFTLMERGRTFAARFDRARYQRNQKLPGSQQSPEVTFWLDGYEAGSALGAYIDDRGRPNWTDMADTPFTPAEMRARAWEREPDAGEWRTKTLHKLMRHAVATVLSAKNSPHITAPR